MYGIHCATSCAWMALFRKKYCSVKYWNPSWALGTRCSIMAVAVCAASKATMQRKSTRALKKRVTTGCTGSASDGGICLEILHCKARRGWEGCYLQTKLRASSVLPFPV